MNDFIIEHWFLIESIMVSIFAIGFSSYVVKAVYKKKLSKNNVLIGVSFIMGGIVFGIFTVELESLMFLLFVSFAVVSFGWIIMSLFESIAPYWPPP